MSLALLAARRAASTSVRAFSSSAGSTGTPTYTGSVYKESESARENLFFSKEDEKNLRKLLSKVKASADNTCGSAGAHNAKEEAALLAITKKYKLSDADTTALYAWRHSNEF